MTKLHKTPFRFLCLLVGFCVTQTLFSLDELPLSRTLPESPSTAQLAAFRVLPEQLWPVDGTPTSAENDDLEDLLRDFAALPPFTGNVVPLLQSIENYLTTHPDSPWNPSLRLNLGLLYYREGFFTRALNTLESCWACMEPQAHPRARALADRAIGEFLLLNSKLGRFEVMETVFEDLEGRSIGGVATEFVSGARMGLHAMHAQPEIAFRCGPMALDRIYAHFDPERPNRQILLEAESTQQGTSLWQNSQWADQAEIPLRLAQRSAGADIPMPALVHWNSGHFAAITDFRDGRYHIEDATFHDAMWVTLEAIEDEASGYFLIPDDGEPLPTGWTAVDQTTAESVWGRGYVYGYDEDETGPCDDQVGCGGDGRGMAVWNVHLMAVSLNLVDTPVAYQPPVGPSIAFTARYNQRDVNQPSVFAYPNLGPKWTFDWVSAIIDNPNQQFATVKHYLSGGGAERYSGFNSTTENFTRQTKSRNLLQRTGPDSYQLTHPDGTIDVFDLSDGVTTAGRRIFLTSRTDPQGNEMEWEYDSQFRLVLIRDAEGQETEVFYDHPTDPLKITKVRDPFGREALLDYDSSGRLIKITDPEGIESEFTYADSGPNADFIEKLTTPYGETHFSFGEEIDGIYGTWNSDTTRWIEVIDPMGLKQRMEYRHAAPGINQNELPVPTPRSGSVSSALNGIIGTRGTQTSGHTRHWRNTFHWDTKTMREMGENLDYTKAHIYQWLHSSDWARSESILESEKAPLEHRIYYNYQGQSNPTVVGTTALVSKIARAINDLGNNTGTSRIAQFAYNDLGFQTREIDPVGRETEYLYAANQIDLLEIRQKIGASWETLATYGDYANHLPGFYTDGSGNTTTYTWNSQGQPLTETNALNETITFTYDHRLNFDPDTHTPSGYGYLYKIEGPVTGATRTFTYDSVGRVHTITDSEGHTRTFEYDNLDRRTRITYPDNTFEEWSYHRLDIASYTDREGRITAYLHNGNRQLMVETDPEGRITQYDYCSCGAINRLIDPNGNTTRWRYDIQGRVTKKIYPDGTEINYTYDPHNGRLIATTDALGQTTHYTYHLDNNLDTISYTGAVHATPSVSHTWDPAFNRLASITDGIGTTTWTYHPHDGTTLGAGQINTVIGPFTNSTIAYAYDELNRRTGRTINPAMGGTGGSANILTRAFDALARLETETNPLGTFDYHYLNETNQISRIDLPDGHSTHFTYRPNNEDRRLERIEHRRADQSILAAHGYQYTADGIITHWQQERSGHNDRTWHFGYDAADQLTSATLKDPQEVVLQSLAWQYDPAGNRIAEEKDASGLIPARHNDLNQLTEHGGGPIRFAGSIDEPGKVWVAGHEARMRNMINFEAWLELSPGTHQIDITAEDYSDNSITQTFEVHIADEGQVFLTYDLNGNLLTRISGTTVTTYEWDAANRLIAIEVEGETRSEFLYDGLSRRIGITEKVWDSNTSSFIPHTSSFYLWDGLTIAEQRSGTAGETVEKRFFPQGVEIGTGSESGTYTYRTDHLGSIREVVDASGNLTARFGYSPWGDLETVSGSFVLDFGFTGHFIHQPTELYLAPFRAYDAGLGRWLSRDPLRDAEFLPEGPNLYAYAANSPIVFVDPTGYSIIFGQTRGQYEIRTEGGRRYRNSSDCSQLNRDLNEIKEAGDRINELTFRGHGGRSPNMITFGGGFVTSTSSGIIDADGNDLVPTLRDLMGENSQINLYGCNTARGDDNLARDFNRLIPQSSVRGYRFYGIGGTNFGIHRTAGFSRTYEATE